MNLARLLLFHAVVTLAAGIVLLIAPAKIPAVVGIHLQPVGYLLCYLLGAAELGLAFLSYYARRLRHAPSLRLVSLTFALIHMVTAGVELYAFAQGVAVGIWVNIAFRMVVSLLFFYWGVYKMPERDSLITA